MGYIRRNMPIPVLTITDFDAFNCELLKKCDDNHERSHYRHGKTIRDLWLEEKRFLIKLPEYEYAVYLYGCI